MSFTNQDISQPSLCHLSLDSSMVRASHRRAEGCGFDSRLGLRNIFWVCESLSSQNVFLYTEGLDTLIYTEGLGTLIYTKGLGTSVTLSETLHYYI